MSPEYLVYFRTYIAGGATVRQSMFTHQFEHALCLIADLRDTHVEYGITADYWMVPA
jgi:hypothetical protein